MKRRLLLNNIRGYTCMNNITKHIIYLLSNNNNPAIIRNWIIHNDDKPLSKTKTMEYINNQNYDLDEARKKSLMMLKNSPHLRYKGPKPLILMTM